MAIVARCECGAERRVKDEAAGKRFKCKECGQPVTVPAKDEPAEDEWDYDEYEDDAYSEDYGDDEYADEEYADDEYAAAPKKTQKSQSSKKSSGKKKKSSGGSGLKIGFNFNRINCAMAAIGVVLLFGGSQELRLSSSSKAEPQEITLAQLLQNGPADNLHLRLSEFLLRDNMVYEQTQSGTWTKIWVPADPAEYDAEGKPILPDENPAALAGADLGNRLTVKFILKSSEVPNDAAMTQLGIQGLAGSVDGLLINKS